MTILATLRQKEANFWLVGTTMRRIALFFVFFCLCSVAQAAILHVPSQYPTIQAGINAAPTGDTVLISAGIFKENPRVNKRISLIGAGQNRTLIKHNTSYPEVVYVSSSGVVI